jgi:hypothetical protein
VSISRWHCFEDQISQAKIVQKGPLFGTRLPKPTQQPCPAAGGTLFINAQQAQWRPVLEAFEASVKK